MMWSSKKTKVIMVVLLLFVAGITTVFAGTKPSKTYEYDALHRLVKAQYSNGKIITYTYDAAGNITSVKYE